MNSHPYQIADEESLRTAFGIKGDNPSYEGIESDVFEFLRRIYSFTRSQEKGKIILEGQSGSIPRDSMAAFETVRRLMDSGFTIYAAHSLSDMEDIVSSGIQEKSAILLVSEESGNSPQSYLINEILTSPKLSVLNVPVIMSSTVPEIALEISFPKRSRKRDYGLLVVAVSMLLSLILSIYIMLGEYNLFFLKLYNRYAFNEPFPNMVSNTPAFISVSLLFFSFPMFYYQVLAVPAFFGSLMHMRSERSGKKISGIRIAGLSLILISVVDYVLLDIIYLSLFYGTPSNSRMLSFFVTPSFLQYIMTDPIPFYSFFGFFVPGAVLMAWNRRSKISSITMLLGVSLFAVLSILGYAEQILVVRGIPESTFFSINRYPYAFWPMFSTWIYLVQASLIVFFALAAVSYFMKLYGRHFKIRSDQFIRITSLKDLTKYFGYTRNEIRRIDQSGSISRDTEDNAQRVQPVQAGSIDFVFHGSEMESALLEAYLAMKDLIGNGFEIVIPRSPFNYSDLDGIKSEKSIIVLNTSSDLFPDLQDSTKAVNRVITDDLSGNISNSRVMIIAPGKHEEGIAHKSDNRTNHIHARDQKWPLFAITACIFAMSALAVYINLTIMTILDSYIVSFVFIGEAWGSPFYNIGQGNSVYILPLTYPEIICYAILALMSVLMIWYVFRAKSGIMSDTRKRIAVYLIFLSIFNLVVYRLVIYLAAPYFYNFAFIPFIVKTFPARDTSFYIFGYLLPFLILFPFIFAGLFLFIYDRKNRIETMLLTSGIVVFAVGSAISYLRQYGYIMQNLLHTEFVGVLYTFNPLLINPWLLLLQYSLAASFALFGIAYIHNVLAMQGRLKDEHSTGTLRGNHVQ